MPVGVALGDNARLPKRSEVVRTEDGGLVLRIKRRVGELNAEDGHEASFLILLATITGRSQVR